MRNISGLSCLVMSWVLLQICVEQNTNAPEKMDQALKFMKAGKMLKWYNTGNV